MACLPERHPLLPLRLVVMLDHPVPPLILQPYHLAHSAALEPLDPLDYHLESMVYDSIVHVVVLPAPTPEHV